MGKKNPTRKKGFTPFLGELPEDYQAPERPRFAVLPFGYDFTATYQKGTAHGPRAILAASAQVEHYDEELRQETFRHGIETAPPVVCREKPERMLSLLEKSVLGFLAQGRLPVVLGGEHSISLATFRALKKHLGLPPAVLHFDAHADLRDSYEKTRFGHGCVVRRMVDEGAKVLQVGIRSLCREEAEFITASPDQVRTVWAHDLHRDFNLALRALAWLPDTPLFVTIDLDVLDPSLLPGTGTPEPGGLNWPQLTSLLREAVALRPVAACDLVELLPLRGLPASDFVAARLAYRLMGYLSHLPQ